MLSNREVKVRTVGTIQCKEMHPESEITEGMRICMKIVQEKCIACDESRNYDC